MAWDPTSSSTHPPASRGTLPLPDWALVSSPCPFGHRPVAFINACVWVLFPLINFCSCFPSLCLHGILSRRTSLEFCTPDCTFSISRIWLSFYSCSYSPIHNTSRYLLQQPLAMVTLFVAVPGSISKLPKDRGRASLFSFALVSELFRWKTWRGCPPAASVSHWRQNSLQKENKVGPQWGTNS